MFSLNSYVIVMSYMYNSSCEVKLINFIRDKLILDVIHQFCVAIHDIHHFPDSLIHA